MRRSRSVIAPLLAAAAVASMHGGAVARAQDSPPNSSVLVHPRSSTIFGGFGRSFSEHPDAWIGAGIFTLIASLGG